MLIKNKSFEDIATPINTERPEFLSLVAQTWAGGWLDAHGYTQTLNRGCFTDRTNLGSLP